MTRVRQGGDVAIPVRAVSSKSTGAMSGLAWCVAPVSILVLTGCLLFPSTGHDDTHITCWPAYTLSHFGQIQNYNGDRVEQSSSLLQVILLAALGALTRVDLVTLAKLSSIAFGIASLLVLFTLVSKVTSRAAGSCAATIAAASIPVVYWSFSGMESSLVSFTVLCLVLAAGDYLDGHKTGSLWKATLAIAAFAMVRPETPLLMGCLLGSAIVIASVKWRYGDPHGAGRKEVERRGLLLLVIAALVCVALFTFRWVYFGALFPQPVAVKFSGLSVRNTLIGLHYLKGHAWNEGPATAIVTLTIVSSVLVTALGQLRGRPLNVYVLLSLLAVAGLLSFAVLSGGDWMEGGRFLVPLLPIAIACVPFALERINAGAWVLPALTAVLVCLELTSAVAFARTKSTSVPLWGRMPAEGASASWPYSWFEHRSRINVRDMPLIDGLGDLVSRISSRRPGPVVIMSGQMGMVPYYLALRHSGRIRFLDRHGLVDRDLTDCGLTRSARKGMGGLELTYDQYFATNSAVLEASCRIARPDIVFDIGPSEVDEHGYQDVYVQTGEVAAVGTRLVGLRILADAFAAVDTRVAASVGPIPKRHVRFGR